MYMKASVEQSLPILRKSTSIESLFECIFIMDSIAVVIPDLTRPFPFQSAMSILSKHCLNVQHVTVGLGLHRMLTETELKQLHCPSEIPLLQHDPDDCEVIEMVDGKMIGFSRHVMACESTLVFGVVEVHQYAGVSGGYKGIVVGCGSRDLIHRLHARESVCHPAVQVGRIEGNPFRQEIERLGRMSNARWACVYVPSLREWWFGSPAQIVEEAQGALQPWYPVNRLYGTVVLDVPDVKGQSFYQASRSATYLALSESPPIEEGGLLVLYARMLEGLGSEQGFVKALEQYRYPWTETLDRDLSGAGAQRIWMLARLAQRFELAVVGVQDASLFASIGIRVLDEIPAGASVLRVTHPFDALPQYVKEGLDSQ